MCGVSEGVREWLCRGDEYSNAMVVLCGVSAVELCCAVAHLYSLVCRCLPTS